MLTPTEGRTHARTHARPQCRCGRAGRRGRTTASIASREGRAPHRRGRAGPEVHAKGQQRRSRRGIGAGRRGCAGRRRRVMARTWEKFNAGVRERIRGQVVLGRTTCCDLQSPRRQWVRGTTPPHLDVVRPAMGVEYAPCIRGWRLARRVVLCACAHGIVPLSPLPQL